MVCRSFIFRPSLHPESDTNNYSRHVENGPITMKQVFDTAFNQIPVYDGFLSLRLNNLLVSLARYLIPGHTAIFFDPWNLALAIPVGPKRTSYRPPFTSSPYLWPFFVSLGTRLQAASWIRPRHGQDIHHDERVHVSRPVVHMIPILVIFYKC